jgi:hypothetical protein
MRPASLTTLAKRIPQRQWLRLSWWRNPITGIAGCCARAASGHAAVALPSVTINSRRWMRIVRSRFQVASFRHSVGTRGHKNGNGRRGGHQLAQQFQSLRAQPSGEKTHACDVPARPVEACDKAVPDRVAPGGEDDRHRRGHGLGRESRKNISDDHGDRSASEIGRQITVVVG